MRAELKKGKLNQGFSIPSWKDIIETYTIVPFSFTNFPKTAGILV